MAPFLCLTPWSFQGMCPSFSAQTRQKNSYSQIFINIPWPQISNPSSIPLKHAADHNYLWLLWCLTTVQNIWVLSNHRTQWWSFLHACISAALLSSGNYYCIHRVYEIPPWDSTWLISCSLFSEWLAFSCKWSLALFLLKQYNFHSVHDWKVFSYMCTIFLKYLSWACGLFTFSVYCNVDKCHKNLGVSSTYHFNIFEYTVFGIK